MSGLYQYSLGSGHHILNSVSRKSTAIYTAELQAVLFALKRAYQSQESKFMIFSDSLSALHALEKLKLIILCLHK